MQIVIDYETRSEADLKKVGAYNYARHPSTEIICIGYKLDDEPAKVWVPDTSQLLPDALWWALKHADVILAHNALFEQVITEFVLKKEFVFLPEFPPSVWKCTAAKAAAFALPRNLEGACLALKLPVQKDMEGRRLTLKYCKPRRETKNNQDKWHSDQNELNRIYEYCKTDVEATYILDQALPDLNPIERKVWELDQKINLRGVRVDSYMVQMILKMINEETEELTREALEITGGVSVTQRDKILEYIGFLLKDLKAKTVRDTLNSGIGIEPSTRRILEIRQAISKTSTKKYKAFAARTGSDDRVRDLLMYHGASTGRWAGQGIQPQNFPAKTLSDIDFGSEVMRFGNLELVRLLYGDPMEAFSQSLRGVIRATPGMELFVSDYNAIELRVLFWVANHVSGLKAITENRDMYREMAAAIYNIKNVEDVTKTQRDLGKRAVLGCGYNMGWKKFLATCQMYDMDVSEELAQRAVNVYRSVHYPVVRVWSNIDRAAIAAVKTGKSYTVNHSKWFKSEKSLYCELPSGRRLAYYAPEIKKVITSWGETRENLHHEGVNPVTKKWELQSTYGGKLTENIVQAISRDLIAEAMLRIDGARYNIVLSVHDEVVAEKEKGAGSVEEFESLMLRSPKWAEGLPVKAETWQGERYKK